MKVGDLVTGNKEKIYDGSSGIMFGFDEDDDPIVAWCNDTGSNETTPGCGEYKNSLRVINENQ